MKGKRLLSCACMFVLLAGIVCSWSSGSGQAGDFKPITIKFSTMYPEDHFTHQSVLRIKKKIEEGTNGNIKVQIFPAGQLGDFTLVTDELIRGTIEIAYISIVDRFDPRMAAGYLPFICDSYEHMEKVFGRDSFLAKELDGINANVGLKYLGLYTEGFLGVGATKEIPHAGDPTARKNFTVRTSNVTTNIETFQAMGFKVATLPYSEVYSALQSGIADGWLGGTPALNYVSFRDIIKYYYHYGCIIEANNFVMSKKVFDKLPKEYQDLIEDACFAESSESFRACKKEDMEYLQKLRDGGYTVVEFTPEEKAAMSATVKAKVWENAKSIYGAKFIDDLIKATTF